jgi:anthranilate synthase component 1
MAAPLVLSRRLVADLETPVSAMLKLMPRHRHAFLLESVEGGNSLGRFSAIGLDPDLIWRCEAQEEGGAAASIDRGNGAVAEPDAPFASLRRLLAESRVDLPAGLPPIAAGLFGYLGYDMVRLVERLPDRHQNELGVPEAMLLRPTVVAVFDNVERTIVLVTVVRDGDEAAAERRLDTVVGNLSAQLPAEPPRLATEPPRLEPRSNTSRDEYRFMVERAREYIRAGDAFQVVPSQRFTVPFGRDAFDLYRALRRLNPSPFLFFLDFGGFQIVGSSPEILVRVRGTEVTIRPIAGTRPRGRTPDEDQALADELLADPKELAEHLMLLDLGRNDVGRIATTGTVRVTQQMIVERYSHVMHIVSNVTGELDRKYDALDALAAGFPAGTVSGAPKVRAMEIIDELEKTRRGVYAGCIGYFGADGSMDTCIALRTGVVKDGTLYVQAGGGVVADSDADSEYQETVNKARALIRAAEEALASGQTRN